MDEVNDSESTPQVACSLSPIETAILICIVAYIIIKVVKKFITHKFSSSQPRELDKDEAVSDNTQQSVENSRTTSALPLGEFDTVAESPILTSENLTEAESEPIEVGDVVTVENFVDYQYYVVVECYDDGNVAITNSTFKVKYDCKPGQLKRVEKAQNKQVTIVLGKEYRCTRDMWVAKKRTEDKQVKIELEKEYRCTRDMSVSKTRVMGKGSEIFHQNEVIIVTNDFHNGMVAGNRIEVVGSYYFPALLLEKVKEDDYIFQQQ